MSNSPNGNPNPSLNPDKNHVLNFQSPLTRRIRPLSSPDVLYEDQALKHGLVKMQLRCPSLSSTPSPSSPPSDPDLTPFSAEYSSPDYTSLLSDELLLRIFAKLPVSHRVSTSLVCKR
ncbi:hypothetical protein SLEP1_g2720 [Rubroshorea leprosula]|uniref:F-box domain-containing protein n=1 Tax=Rubroshorea leprosula TaxID=152421 RepID=A0AAV5HS91_9ROSI|nr:hypothetical protein SLEP1_g2720 [Rubroshorea leprosula]